MARLLKQRPIMKHNKAFSLTELLIVLAVIAILASVATLRFGYALDNAQITSAADRLIADLQLVRDQAIRNQQSYTLTIDTASCSYQAPGVRSLANRPDIIANLALQPYRVSAIAGSAGDDLAVTFDHRGQVDQPGVIILQSGSRRATIVINQDGSIERTQ